MNLESAFEHTEQESPRLAVFAETDCNSVVQKDGEGEQLSAKVTPGTDQKVATYQVTQDAATLNDAGVALLRQYWTSGQEVDLNEAVERLSEALHLTLPSSPDKPVMMSNLGSVLYTRYEVTRTLADLEAAIVAFRQAVQATASDSPNRSGLLNNLGIGLRDRYWHTRTLADLEAAIVAFRQAVQATASDSPNRPALLSRLGSGLAIRYNCTGELTNLEAAIGAFQQAIQMTESDSPDLLGYLGNLGNGLRIRYERIGDLTDLEAAILAFQQAVQMIASDSPGLPALLDNLGNGLRIRYGRTGRLADLEAAITIFQQAVQMTASDSPDRPGYLNNLGGVLRIRYERTGEVADLEAAITIFQQAVQMTASDSPDRSGYLSNLGNGLRDRSECTGEQADLEAAIVAFQQAVQATPADSPALPALLGNLGNGLRTQYERTGEVADLEAAITVFQQAIQTTASDSSDRPGHWNNLGNGLRIRSERTGDLTDLEAAITAFRQAVQMTASDSPDRPGYLGNLGIGLRIRSEHTGERADLEAAIFAFQQAVQAAPSDSPNRPKLLDSLGIGLRNRYGRTGELVDLEAAIAAFQQAVHTTPFKSPDRPARLNNLGNGLSTRYEHTGELTDLDAAIITFQQAVRETPSHSPYWSTFLINLGSGLRARYKRTGDLTNLETVIKVWEKSWSRQHQSFAVLPVTYQLGQQHQGTGIVASLVEAYLEQAKHRHFHSPSVPRRVLEIAESSKSRLLTQVVGRGPLPLPAGLSPEIAIREQQLLATLTALDTRELTSQNSLVSPQDKASHFLRVQQRQAALYELEDLWTVIGRYGREGNAYIALRRGTACTWQEFVRLAKALGRATMLLSFFRTHDQALLLLLRTSWREPQVVEVSLNQIGWTDLLARFFREVHGHGLRGRSETWDQLLRPLFTTALHHLEGVERLILAPHDAGHLLPWAVLVERAGWRTSSGQSLPLITLPALSIFPSLRQRPHVRTGPALVVGNPHGDLPYAEVEAREVAERFGTKPLLGAAATKCNVLAHFPDATLIHLATHAFFDADNPLESGIVLADGVLTAREVLQHHLQADLLVLSACESGQVGSLGGEELAGLSQAFLHTGVRSLLVSLWQVNDPATAALMQAFYRARQVGADKALALRQAMTQIQQDPRWTHPYYWGAFILLGDWD